MRSLFFMPIALMLSLFSVTVSAAEKKPKTPTPAPVILHRFAILDNGPSRLVLVDQVHPELNWSVNVPHASRDLQRLGMVTPPPPPKKKPSGGAKVKPPAPDPLQFGEPRILVSHGDGAGEYSIANGKLLWSVNGQQDISSARRLPNGNTVLGSSQGGVHLITVDPKGKVVSNIPVDCPGDLRLIRLTPDGHYLLGLAGPHMIFEVDAAGKKVAEYKLPGKGYIGERLLNGNVLAATGEGLTVAEIDPQGKIVHSIGGKEAFPNARLLWFSSFDRIADGHLLVANWCGHGQEGKGPHLLEFDYDNKLIWQWEDHKLVTMATSVLGLDER